MDSEDEPTATGGQAGESDRDGVRPDGQGEPGGRERADDPTVGGRSVTDVLSEPAGQAVIKYVVGLFAIVGAGFGLSGLLLAGQFSGGGYTVGSAVVFSALGVAIFGGPFLAFFFGRSDLFDVGREPSETYLLGFVGTAAGYVVMALLTVVLLSLSDAAGTVDVGEFVVPLLLGGVVTGLVTAGVQWFGDRTDLPA